MPDEARLEETAGGLEPAESGWLVVNVSDAAWYRNDVFGASCGFEGARNKAARFQEYGINIHVVWPGQPNCMYHGEEAQEDFLVLSGECLLLVEGTERHLKPWDFVHFPKWTEHVVVGAGDGPCAILMVGARADEGLIYPVNELAQKCGAGVAEETNDPRQAYAPFPEWRQERVDDPGLPWN
jgi:uncharacterized cupin superfamily protein